MTGVEPCLGRIRETRQPGPDVIGEPGDVGGLLPGLEPGPFAGDHGPGRLGNHVRVDPPASCGRTAASTRSTLGDGGVTGTQDPPGGNAWESNPPRRAERRATGFEDQGTHRDPTAPGAMVALSSASMTVTEPTPYRLTELTDCGGCAAKLGADLLAEALSGLVPRPRRRPPT